MLFRSEPLRYYFAAKLGPGIDDMDLSLDDFVSRFNADVVGKVVNIASRCAGFIARGGGRLADALPDPELYADFASAAGRIAGLYESRDFVTAIREIATLADGTKSKDDLKAFAEEVSRMIDEGIQTANARHQGDYLFGGTADSQPPDRKSTRLNSSHT